MARRQRRVVQAGGLALDTWPPGVLSSCGDRMAVPSSSAPSVLIQRTFVAQPDRTWRGDPVGQICGVVLLRADGQVCSLKPSDQDRVDAALGSTRDPDEDAVRQFGTMSCEALPHVMPSRPVRSRLLVVDLGSVGASADAVP